MHSQRAGLSALLSFLVCAHYTQHYSLAAKWEIFTELSITMKTRMVQLPATAAIEYVAACCRTRTRTKKLERKLKLKLKQKLERKLER